MTVSEASHSTTKQRDWEQLSLLGPTMVGENVPRAFSSKDGEDFRTVLEETTRLEDQFSVAGAYWMLGLCSAEHNFLNVKLRKMLSHLLKCSKASKNAPAGFTLSIICPSRKNEVHHHSDGRPHS